MEKLKMMTPDKATENFKKLAALFPNAVTETKDSDGNIVRAIDKDILMQEINGTVVEGNLRGPISENLSCWRINRLLRRCGI